MLTLPTTQRVQHYDILKGIAIIFVVAIHTLNYSVDKEVEVSPFLILWRNIICFAVPLFIAISGYFVANKKLDSVKNYSSYLYKQLPRVLIPYLLWALFYSSFHYLGGCIVKDNSA